MSVNLCRNRTILHDTLPIKSHNPDANFRYHPPPRPLRYQHRQLRPHIGIFSMVSTLREAGMPVQYQRAIAFTASLFLQPHYFIRIKVRQTYTLLLWTSKAEYAW